MTSKVDAAPLAPDPTAATKTDDATSAPCEEAVQQTLDKSVEGTAAAGGESEKANYLRGDVVRISGLKSATELNGKLATVKGWNDKKERWVVHVPGVESGAMKRIKDANLTFIERPARSREQQAKLEVKSESKEPFVPNQLGRKADITKFVFGKKIGEGANSTILLATVKPDYDLGVRPVVDQVALKQISRRRLTINRNAKMLQRSLINEKK